ncbi:hypothetical protein [Burkholderia ambifaria]|uniref:hypothetical protein n=1 Tax=Burkholderia ambifaria TaxID=152480 RepID=UPI001FC8C27A|nr:hypothetical protein [Burkholderia ambifaria]
MQVDETRQQVAVAGQGRADRPGADRDDPAVGAGFEQAEGTAGGGEDIVRRASGKRGAEVEERSLHGLPIDASNDIYGAP